MKYYEKRAWICWTGAFVAALAVQIVFNVIGLSFVTSFLMMVLTSVVFAPKLRFRERIAQQQQQPTSSEHHPAPELEDVEILSAEQHPDLGATDMNIPPETTRTAGDETHTATSPSGASDTAQHTSRPRLHFLDNLKVFLTFMVVTHHVACAFGGCGSSWYLVLGEDDNNWFGYVVRAFTLLNQAYFMPLFFLISAYFTPSGYDRKGHHQLLNAKAQRLWIPAMMVSFTVVPASAILSQVVTSSNIMYIPNPGPTWFLFWLLIFNWIYASLRVARNRDAESIDSPMRTGAEVNEDETNAEKSFPWMCIRWMYGILVCGFAMLFIYVILAPNFWSMPITVGSFANDVLFFGAGCVAANHGWFENSNGLVSCSTWKMSLLVFFEAVALVLLLQLVEESDVWGLPFFATAGIYCVDVSLMLLLVFQRFADRPLKHFSEAAFGVYLIHPLIVTGFTAIFVTVYNSMHDDVIQFGIDCDTGKPDDDYAHVSCSELQGPDDGSVALIIGFILVFTATHLVVWPLAWILRRLPGLRHIL